MNAEELIERLKKSFNAPSKKDERLKVVLMCIVISTTFWFFNALNQNNYTSQIDYPIEWTFDRDQYVAVSEMPAAISLEVNGGGWDLMTRFFGFNMMPLSIPLSEPNSPNYLLTSQLRADLSRNLDPVSINFIIEDSLKYNVQRLVSKQLALEFDPSEVNFDSEYRLSSEYRLQPEAIMVTGPENVLSEMPTRLEVKRSLNGIDADFNEEIRLPELPRLVDPELENVRLSFEVMRYLDISETKEVELINFPDTTWIAVPNEIAIDYKIGEAVFDVTDSSRIQILADYERWNPQDSTVALEVIQGRKLIDNINLALKRVKIYKP